MTEELNITISTQGDTGTASQITVEFGATETDFTDANINLTHTA